MMSNERRTQHTTSSHSQPYHSSYSPHGGDGRYPSRPSTSPSPRFAPNNAPLYGNQTPNMDGGRCHSKHARDTYIDKTMIISSLDNDNLIIIIFFPQIDRWSLIESAPTTHIPHHHMLHQWVHLLETDTCNRMYKRQQGVHSTRTQAFQQHLSQVCSTWIERMQ